MTSESPEEEEAMFHRRPSPGRPTDREGKRETDREREKQRQRRRGTERRRDTEAFDDGRMVILMGRDCEMGKGRRAEEEKR